MTWNVRIGINPISWMNDDLPSLGGETPLETALAEGKEIGYEGFELGNKFPKDGPGAASQAGRIRPGLRVGLVLGLFPGAGADTVSGRRDRTLRRAHEQSCNTTA
jgi:inosose dehydratase